MSKKCTKICKKVEQNLHIYIKKKKIWYYLKLLKLLNVITNTIYGLLLPFKKTQEICSRVVVHNVSEGMFYCWQDIFPAWKNSSLPWLFKLRMKLRFHVRIGLSPCNALQERGTLQCRSCLKAVVQDC